MKKAISYLYPGLKFNPKKETITGKLKDIDEFFKKGHMTYCGELYKV